MACARVRPRAASLSAEPVEDRRGERVDSRTRVEQQSGVDAVRDSHAYVQIPPVRDLQGTVACADAVVDTANTTRTSDAPLTGIASWMESRERHIHRRERCAHQRERGSSHTRLEIAR